MFFGGYYLFMRRLYGESLVYLSGKGFSGPRLDIRPDSLIFQPTRRDKSEKREFFAVNVGSEGFNVDSFTVSEPRNPHRHGCHVILILFAEFRYQEFLFVLRNKMIEDNDDDNE